MRDSTQKDEIDPESSGPFKFFRFGSADEFVNNFPKTHVGDRVYISTKGSTPGGRNMGFIESKPPLKHKLSG